MNSINGIGGAGGLLAAETLRSQGYSGKVIMVSREPYLPIDRPKLSKSLKLDASKIQLRDEEFFNSFDIQTLLNTVMNSIHIVLLIKIGS